MNTHLRGLRRADGNLVFAEFSVDGDDRLVSTVFTVSEGAVATASADPDVFGGFQGTADELRSIIAAVIAFSRATA